MSPVRGTVLAVAELLADRTKRMIAMKKTTIIWRFSLVEIVFLIGGLSLGGITTPGLALVTQETDHRSPQSYSEVELTTDRTSEATCLAEGATGIINADPSGRQLSAEQLRDVAGSLESVTGIRGITFDSYGRLSLKEDQVDQLGSKTAREILLSAVHKVLIILEDHSQSADIAFAEIELVCVLHCLSGGKVEVYLLKLDFKDFQHLGGDEDAVEAFSLGFVLLHEFVHATEKKRDPTGVSGAHDPGECEEPVNRARRELDLPIRIRYKTQRVDIDASGTVMFERLEFLRLKLDGGKYRQELRSVHWPRGFVR
jgi:hypothetical protein